MHNNILFFTSVEVCIILKSENRMDDEVLILKKWRYLSIYLSIYLSDLVCCTVEANTTLYSFAV